MLTKGWRIAWLIFVAVLAVDYGIKVNFFPYALFANVAFNLVFYYLVFMLFMWSWRVLQLLVSTVRHQVPHK